MINQNILKKYTNAFIMYEIAAHGEDPRDSLENTLMRSKSYEGYKYQQFKIGRSKLLNSATYTEAILSALPGYNLVDRFQKDKIEEIIRSKGIGEFESALRDLYDEDKDELAFSEIVDVIGGLFDVLGFIFFLKDYNKYLPIRSRSFDERFKLLGLESELAGNCTWETYKQYITWIDEIRGFLVAYLNKETTLLDAHSFLWILPRLEEYLKDDAQIARHKKFGKGIVVDADEKHITVKFTEGIKKFDKDIVFKDGILIFEIPAFDIDKVAKMPLESVNEVPKDNTQINPSIPKTVLNKKALEVTEALLKLIANRRRVITYGELSELTESKPSPYYEMNALLDSINRRCDELGLPYISAMVVNKSTGLPGDGFKELCVSAFGYDADLSIEEIFDDELNKIGKCDEWNKLANSIGIEMPIAYEDERLPEEIDDQVGQPIIEGAKKTITVNAYERDSKARRKCKDYYMKRDGKIICQICGFDFGDVYGLDYSNMIHIHHIKPLSEIGESYIVDPVEDLIPVCPNCHMVLHAKGNLTVDEVRTIIQAAKYEGKRLMDVGQ